MPTRKDGLAQSENEQLVFIRGNRPFTTSRKVAEIFNKNHKDVLRGIQNLGCSEEFGRRNFAPTSYTDSWNREQSEYLLTKDGFVILVMGYTGEKAMSFKEFYIERFNEMETRLRQREEKQLLTMKDFVRIGGSGFEDVMKPIPTYLDECDRNVRPYMLTLEKMGYSLKSGSIWRRQNRYPLQFTNVDGILCITEDYAERLYLNKVNAHNDKVLSQVQLAFNFKKEGGSHDNN